MGLEYVLWRGPIEGRPGGFLAFGSGVFSFSAGCSPFSSPASSFSESPSASLPAASVISSSGLAVCVSGSGPGRVPVTMSASQSPRPPGAASTAVCGLYTYIFSISNRLLLFGKACCTLIPSSASRSRDCCWVSASVRALNPLNMIGSVSVRAVVFKNNCQWSIRYETTTQSFRSIASSATAFVRSMVRRTEFI